MTSQVFLSDLTDLYHCTEQRGENERGEKKNNIWMFQGSKFDGWTVDVKKKQKERRKKGRKEARTEGRKKGCQYISILSADVILTLKVTPHCKHSS